MPNNEKTVLSFSKETPLWSKWMFRIVFAMTTAVTVFVASTNLISEEWKYEIILMLKAIDPIVYAVSKMFGIDKYEK